MWFKRGRRESDLPLSRVDYPYGTCVETENGTYLVRAGYRLKMLTDRVVDSWGLRVVVSTEKATAHLPVKDSLGFRDGALIKDASDGRVYLIAFNKRRHVVTPDLDMYGLSFKDALLVSREEVHFHPEGDDLK